MALLIASESVVFNPTLIVLKVKGILFQGQFWMLIGDGN